MGQEPPECLSSPRASSQPPLPAKSSALSDQKLTLGDAWLEVFQQVLPRNQFCAAGKLVARAYREEFGEEPPRRQQFVDGAPRQVKSYRRWGCTQGRLEPAASAALNATNRA